mgnify:CR=1 FL=1
MRGVMHEIRIKLGLALGTTLAIIIGMLQIAPTIAGPHPVYANPVEPQMTPRLNLGKINYEANFSSFPWLVISLLWFVILEEQFP